MTELKLQLAVSTAVGLPNHAEKKTKPKMIIMQADEMLSVVKLLQPEAMEMPKEAEALLNSHRKI